MRAAIFCVLFATARASAGVQVDSVPLAEFTEDSYQSVAAHKSDADMSAYMKNFLAHLGLKVIDEGGFNGFVPFFSGTRAVQSLNQLRQELTSSMFVAVANHSHNPNTTTVANASSTFEKKQNEAGDAQPQKFLANKDEGLATSSRSSPQSSSSDGLRDDMLPEVDDMLARASGMLSNVKAKAKVMEERVHTKQQLTAVKLAQSKASFEQALNEQASMIRSTRHANREISSEIADQESKSSDLKKDTHRLQEANKVLRQVFADTSDKFNLASEFLDHSLAETTDDETTMSVLKETTPKPTLDFFLSVARGGEKAKGLSFVQQEREPEVDEMPEYLKDMVQSLTDLDLEEERGEERLKESFEAALMKGDSKLSELIKEQKALNSTRQSSQDSYEKLLAAHVYLSATRKQLRERISGLQEFADKVEDVANTAMHLSHASIAKA